MVSKPSSLPSAAALIWTEPAPVPTPIDRPSLVRL
jgi:hypothetical protein